MLTNRSCKLELATKVEIITHLKKDRTVTLSLRRLCKIFRLSQGTYYARLKPTSKRRLKDNIMKEKRIITIFETNNRVYGVEKLKKELDKKANKPNISRQKTRKIMRDNGLYPVYMRKYKPKHWRKDLETRVNILNGDFKISEPNKVWSADTRCS